MLMFSDSKGDVTHAYKLAFEDKNPIVRSWKVT